MANEDKNFLHKHFAIELQYAKFEWGEGGGVGETATVDFSSLQFCKNNPKLYLGKLYNKPHQD